MPATSMAPVVSHWHPLSVSDGSVTFRCTPTVPGGAHRTTVDTDGARRHVPAGNLGLCSGTTHYRITLRLHASGF